MRLPRPTVHLPDVDSLFRRPGDRREKPPGHAPGELVHVGQRRADEVTIQALEYDASSVGELAVAGALRPPADPAKVTWINVTGLHGTDTLRALADTFQIHPLIQEDILNTRSRPKLEIYDNYIFASAKLLHHSLASGTIEAQHFSFLLLPDDSLLTFLEAPTSVFEPVFRRIHSGTGRIRQSGADYLAWVLLDTIIDHYYSIADAVDEAILDLEDNLDDSSFTLSPAQLFELKREASALYRIVHPIRDLTSTLHRSESDLLSPELRPYLRDLHDHALHLLDQTTHLREDASALHELYLSEASHRMNRTIRILTCFSAIFLPLTFLSGVYGMNFRHMPELALPWAYPLLWAIFIFISSLMWLFFVRRRWL
jgi:magnesium transporter